MIAETLVLCLEFSEAVFNGSEIDFGRRSGRLGVMVGRKQIYHGGNDIAVEERQKPLHRWKSRTKGVDGAPQAGRVVGC